jgi:hypothetical protein
MAEPTKEELMARIAELEKQARAKKAGRLEFKVSEKGGVSVYGWGVSPRPFITNNGAGSLMPEKTCVLSWKQTRAA